MTKQERINDLVTAVELTEACIRHCRTPSLIDLHISCLANYKKELEELKKDVDK